MIFFVAFLAAITPGPDILLVLRESLKNGFLSAFKTLYGIATGWVIYIIILYLGFAHFLSNDFAQIGLGIFGGIYLLYLSFLLFRSQPNQIDLNGTDSKESKKLSTKSKYLKGLIINLSNPKAIIFFSAIVAPFMEKNLILNLVLLFLGLNSAFLSVMFLASYFRNVLTNRLFDIIDKICAVMFLGFGIALLIMAGEKAWNL